MPGAARVDEDTMRDIRHHRRGRTLGCGVRGGRRRLTSGPAANPPNWAKPQIKTVVEHGLTGATASRLSSRTRRSPSRRSPTSPPASGATRPPSANAKRRPRRRQTGTRPGRRTSTTTGRTSSGAATMAQPRRRARQPLGPLPQAKQFTKAAIAAGLKVPRRFGTEVVARLLGLRIDHPAARTTSSCARRTRRRAPRRRTPRRRFSASAISPTAGRSPASSSSRPRSRSRRSRRGSSGSSTSPSRRSGCRTSGAGRATTPRPSSASRRAAATTAPASSGVSTSSRATRTKATSPRSSSGGRRTQMSVEVPHRSGSLRQAPAGRRHLLRRERGEVAALRDRPHGHLPRRRLVHPLLRGGRRSRDTHRLLPTEFAWGRRPLHEAGLRLSGPTLRHQAKFPTGANRLEYPLRVIPRSTKGPQNPSYLASSTNPLEERNAGYGNHGSWFSPWSLLRQWRRCSGTTAGCPSQHR